MIYSITTFLIGLVVGMFAMYLLTKLTFLKYLEILPTRSRENRITFENQTIDLDWACSHTDSDVSTALRISKTELEAVMRKLERFKGNTAAQDALNLVTHFTKAEIAQLAIEFADAFNAIHRSAQITRHAN